MRPLRNTTEWPKIAVYDIEATQWVNVALTCHVDEYGNRRSFPDIASYLDFIYSNDFAGEIVWAHFGGRYDHRFLITEVYNRGWELNAALSGGSIVILAITDDKGRKIKFADSFRIMPEALAKIGKTINLEKLDVNRSHMETLTHEEMETYCFRDCDIVLRGLQYMRDVLTSVGADFAFTLASIATRWVRVSNVVDFNRFYRPKRKGKGIEYNPLMLFADHWAEGLDRPPIPSDPIVYSAYHGGRTEMFHDSRKNGIVKGPVYYYDVVSSYPWSMTNDLPLYLDDFHPPPKSTSPSDIRRFLSHYGITEAWVRIPQSFACPLPLQIDKRPLVFPYGAFQGRYTNIELLAALDRGAEVKLGWQCRFEARPFLLPFVKTFYSLRKQAKADNDLFRTFAFKILLNSLYGKLVETIVKSSYTTYRDEILRADPKTLKATKVAGLYSLESLSEGPFRHVAAGAYVTARSRLKLQEGIETVLAKGGQVYYCDTDSIMSSVPLPELEGEGLGEWKAEYVFSEVEILLPKVYRAKVEWAADGKSVGDTIYRCKGLPIVREHEEPYIPEQRWAAFRDYVLTRDDPDKQVEAAAMARLLSRDGISGMVKDINAGRIYPIRENLTRALQSSDRKRDWSDFPSRPLHLQYESNLVHPFDIQRRVSS